MAIEELEVDVPIGWHSAVAAGVQVIAERIADELAGRWDCIRGWASLPGKIEHGVGGDARVGAIRTVFHLRAQGGRGQLDGGGYRESQGQNRVLRRLNIHRALIRFTRSDGIRKDLDEAEQVRLWSTALVYLVILGHHDRWNLGLRQSMFS
jgi:hypothetical protein